MKTQAFVASLADLETPCVVVDRAVLERNIQNASAIARLGGVALRPHAKAHKSVAIARLQLASGAIGLTVAKTDEALAFIDAGVMDVTVAHPLVDPRKAGRLLSRGARTGARVQMIADSMAGIEAIGEAARAVGTVAEVLLKVDVGLHRCGVHPAGPFAVQLAIAIEAHDHLRFGGILSHAGHAYSADGPGAIREIAETERRTMTDVASAIRRSGVAVDRVSVGSTPTVWVDEGFAGMTEIRPGNSVFMDLTAVSLGIVDRSALALTVLATVVSCNEQFAIVDAGSKVLSSDRGPHGSNRMTGYGVAVRLSGGGDMPVVSLSEEHGFVAHGGRPLAVGDRLCILPNHACSVANLARRFCVLDHADGVEFWPIEASGLVL